MAISLVIACRTELFAEGLKCLVASEPDIDVLGSGTALEEIIELLGREPDIVLIDASLFGEVIQEIPLGKNRHFLLIPDGDPLPWSYEDLKELVPMGLAGILAKDSDREHFCRAIRKVHSGELWLDNHTISELLKSQVSWPRNVELTRKELEVLKYVREGDSNKVISEKLFISEQTVKTHVNHLFKKFGVANRVQLALAASQLPSLCFTRLENASAD